MGATEAARCDDANAKVVGDGQLSSPSAVTAQTFTSVQSDLASPIGQTEQRCFQSALELSKCRGCVMVRLRW